MFWQLKRTQMNLVQYFYHSEAKNGNQTTLKLLKTAVNLRTLETICLLISSKNPLVPPSWIVQNVTPRELSQRSIPPMCKSAFRVCNTFA
jgi:hypothetical protein